VFALEALGDVETEGVVHEAERLVVSPQRAGEGLPQQLNRSAEREAAALDLDRAERGRRQAEAGATVPLDELDGRR
jgi:hypothetical protein